MGDILKEAIADAKAVRETALANAKMALEEAFTPQLKSMLSAKLREDDDEFEDEEEFGGGEEEIPMAAPEEDEFGGEEEIPAEDPFAAPEEDEFGGEEEIPAAETDVEEVIEINGIKYAPVVSEDEGEIGGEEEIGIEDDNLDLEAIIRELETEINEEDGEEGEEIEESEDGMEGESENVEGDEKPEHVGGNIGEGTLYEIDDSLFEEEDDDGEEIDEQTDSSDIGNGDNALDAADGSDEEDPGAGSDKPGEASQGDIGESYKSVKSELKEYKEAVKYLKDKLHEVNLLNAKLLFTNKLFREFGLDNNQKMKVVENFDRAQTVREIKLVYATLAEGFKDNSGVKRKSIKESASAKSGSTKPKKKIISEETKVANRFKKLAGLI